MAQASTVTGSVPPDSRAAGLPSRRTPQPPDSPAAAGRARFPEARVGRLRWISGRPGIRTPWPASGRQGRHPFRDPVAPVRRSLQWVWPHQGSRTVDRGHVAVLLSSCCCLATRSPIRFDCEHFCHEPIFVAAPPLLEGLTSLIHPIAGTSGAAFAVLIVTGFVRALLVPVGLPQAKALADAFTCNGSNCRVATGKIRSPCDRRPPSSIAPRTAPSSQALSRYSRRLRCPRSCAPRLCAPRLCAPKVTGTGTHCSTISCSRHPLAGHSCSSSIRPLPRQSSAVALSVLAIIILPERGVTPFEGRRGTRWLR